MHGINERIRLKQLPAARLTLILLAAGNSWLWCALYLLPWNLLLLLTCISGTTPLISCLLSILIILILDGIIVSLLKQAFLEFKCSSENVRVMRRILSERSTRKKLKEVNLAKSSDAWEAVDGAYYIRVNKGSSAILFAADIDFSSVAIHTEYTISEVRRFRNCAESRTFHRYTLLRKNGKRIQIQLDEIESFLGWIHGHNGRTVYHIA